MLRELYMKTADAELKKSKKLLQLCDSIRLNAGFPIFVTNAPKKALSIVMTMMLSRGSNRFEYEWLLTALLILNNGHRKEMNERDYDMVNDMEGVVEKSHEETDGWRMT
ncbi:hypothetical protein TNCV_2699491 [Trichonephila clavipes]|nr:hypothetical protein TNCV_2699491 [Trichonephila clavipes]